MKYISIFIFLFALIITMSSCEIINPEEVIPAYVYIESFNVETDFTKEGANSQNIQDVWVYVNNENIGIFELPATIPVIKEGTHDVIIYAGIKENGISAIRAKYPFYKTYNTSMSFQPEVSATLKPSIGYFPDIQFAFLEDFENTGYLLQVTSSSELKTIGKSKNDSVFNGGNYAASFVLDDSIRSFECINSEELELPQNNSPVYLEMDYKNDYPFYVGIRSYYQGSETEKIKLKINPASDWSKIYVNFWTEINLAEKGSTFRIVFNASLPDTVANALFEMDNLKIIHN